MYIGGIAYAQSTAVPLAVSFVNKLKVAIIYPLIMLMLGIAVIFFLWGVFEYVYNSSDEGGRTTGRKHMMWGIIGFVVMLSAVAIFKIAANTFGIDASQVR